MDVTLSDTGDPNQLNLSCSSAVPSQGSSQPEAAVFEFFDALGQPKMPPPSSYVAGVGGVVTLDLDQEGDVVGRCSVGGATSSVVAIASELTPAVAYHKKTFSLFRNSFKLQQ